MRVLQITIQAPGSRSGGEIGVRQTLLSLKGNGYEVDYIGPEIEDDAIRALYSHVFELEAGHNTLLRIWDTLHGNTNQRYRSWLKFSKVFDFSKYDAIVMDFTKLDYVLEQVPVDKVIVRAHNVEADYSARNYEFHKSFSNYLDSRFAPRREAAILRKIKHLVVLTDKDVARFAELYDLSGMNVVVDPVCIEAPENVFFMSSDEHKPCTILLTGSLWFGPNYEGVKWFLQDVYPKLAFEKRVIIAGAHPNDELKAMASKLPDCEIIDTPPMMEPYFREADFYIAPVFDGAGMKVKVAEAMSYGLPVIGTEHAFIGYDITGTDGLYQCTDAAAFAEAANEVAAWQDEARIRVRTDIRKLFEKRYSMKTSCDIFSRMVESVAGRKDGSEK